jgi:hypothetical protein
MTLESKGILKKVTGEKLCEVRKEAPCLSFQNCYRRLHTSSILPHCTTQYKPNLYQDVDGYATADDEIHKLSRFEYYTVFSLMGYLSSRFIHYTRLSIRKERTISSSHFTAKYGCSVEFYPSWFAGYSHRMHDRLPLFLLLQMFICGKWHQLDLMQRKLWSLWRSAHVNSLNHGNTALSCGKKKGESVSNFRVFWRLYPTIAQNG